MPSADKTSKVIRLDERLHVEKPFLEQLAGLGWEVIDCDSQQQPGQTFRENVIIEKGITAGESVVTDGQSRLFPGAKVKSASTSNDQPAQPAQPAKL